MTDVPSAARTVVVLARPRFSFHPGVRPTVVVDGRGQPAQWGIGTWQLAEGAVVGVYLFNRLWRYGVAEMHLPPGAVRVEYTAPWWPFGRGRLTSSSSDASVR